MISAILLGVEKTARGTGEGVLHSATLILRNAFSSLFTHYVL